ncbi:MAG: hypothetical protein R3314_05185 [Longimicrobiales bacterium]|nr:hypothetical protein [Longimicrobiales bacterium]
MAQGPGPRSPEQAILMMRIIGISLGTGVTLFAFVSWFLHREQGPIATEFDASLFFNGFVALFLIAGLGALFVWRTRVAPVIQRPTEETHWRPRAAAIQTGVIIAWALLEGAALVGEVVYFLTGHWVAGLMGVLLIWGGIGLTWPKRGWL